MSVTTTQLYNVQWVTNFGKGESTLCRAWWTEETIRNTAGNESVSPQCRQAAQDALADIMETTP